MRSKPTYIHYDTRLDGYLTDKGDYAGSIVASWGEGDAPVTYRAIPCGASGMYGLTFRSAYAGELYLYACALEAYEMGLRSVTVTQATGGAFSGAGHVKPRNDGDGGSLVPIATASPRQPSPSAAVSPAAKAAAFFAGK